jgi:hypothetical protein
MLKVLFNKPEQIVPLMKEHFCDILGLLGIKINFRNNEDKNQHIATTNCDV